MYKHVLFLLSSLCIVWPSYGEETANVDNLQSEDVLESLQEDMQEYSRIATETRQNGDYMPYIISTWNADELSNLGISTLREALSLVPGVDISVGMAGKTTPFFRGSNPYALGQSKLIIDGVVVNDRMFGAYHQFLDLPVALIQRIEVVRGPGSVLSHVNGYAGSIHVITKANRDDSQPVKDEVFAAVGSNDHKMAGLVASYELGDLKVSGDLAYQTHDQTLPGGIDRFGTTGDTPQWLDNYNLGFNAKYQNFKFKSRLSRKDNGVSYGQSYSITEDPNDSHEVEQNFFELGYENRLSRKIKVELVVGYMEIDRGIRNKVIPDGGTMAYPDGRYLISDFGESTVYERLEFQLTNIGKHHLTLGTIAYQSKVDEDTARFSADDFQTFTTTDIVSTTHRDMYSVYADDLINLDEKNSIQLGLKYDHYSDVASQASPRLALVHRYNNKNIYKFMYTRSYREPSWREQYMTLPSFFRSSENLVPEEVDAYELGYIYKFELHNYLKINTFYLDNKDQVHAQNTSSTFMNSGDNNLYGAELEYKHLFNNEDEFYFNYSYVEGENVTNRLADSAHNMVKTYYVHKYSEKLNITGLGKFVGEKERIETDTRDVLSGYAVFDLSAVYKHKSTDTTINFSIKNIFDKTYYFAAPANTYPGDYEQEGRTYQLGIKKGF